MKREITFFCVQTLKKVLIFPRWYSEIGTMDAQLYSQLLCKRSQLIHSDIQRKCRRFLLIGSFVEPFVFLTYDLYVFFCQTDRYESNI